MALSRSPGDTAKLVVALNEDVDTRPVAAVVRESRDFLRLFGEAIETPVGLKRIDALSLFSQRLLSIDPPDFCDILAEEPSRKFFTFLSHHISFFLKDLVSTVMGEACDDGRWSAYEVSFFIKAFNENLPLGVEIVIKLVELVPNLFREQFGREISDEEFSRIINGRSFLNLILAMGLGSAIKMEPLLKIIFTKVHGALNVDKFHFSQMGEELCLEMNDEVFEAFGTEAVRKHVANLVIGKVAKQARGCPMHAASLEDGSKAFPDIIKWIIGVAEREYLG